MEKVGPTGRRVAQRLHELRRERGVTLGELQGRLTELGRPILLSALSKIEKGQRRVDVDDLIALALALAVPPNDLLLPNGHTNPDVEVELTPRLTANGEAAWRWATEGRDIPPTVNTADLVAALSFQKPEHGSWITLGGVRTVLIATHAPTDLMRLTDIVALLETDHRVQLIYTQVPDQYGAGQDQHLRQQEVRVIPWSQATKNRFDLVISASLHRLRDIPGAARFAAPHGAGYNKLWPTWAWPQNDETRPVYGLDRASLLSTSGQPLLDALVLPHPDDLAALKQRSPEAAQSAIVAGDPSFDRLLQSRPHREHYRAQLGISSTEVLVAVASTWGPNALLARDLDLLLRLPSELPSNHRIVATIHPAIWLAHGGRQVKTWLREVRAAGVDLVDGGEDWRGLLAAADMLIGDHGSLTAYAAGVGVPVLMNHHSEDDPALNSIMPALAEQGPRLNRDAPLFDQLTAAKKAQPAQRAIADNPVAAHEGASAEIIRETLYRLLSLPEPTYSASWPPVPTPRLVQD